ncbi:hypothetical protein ABZS61_34400 [Streptomyces sp. NPDC005566]|uniref:hypothetical protein n=1 Tax=Streptomyces sp. NPDC005566 TaxID=3156886 RepID=UPI0033A3CB22
MIRHVLDPVLTMIAPFDVAAASLWEFLEQLGHTVCEPARIIGRCSVPMSRPMETISVVG